MCITINTKYKKCQAEYASPAVRLSRDFGAKIFQKSSHDDPAEASSWPARGGPAW
jgi:hypothetical protein